MLKTEKREYINILIEEQQFIMTINIKKISHENLDELKEISIETFVETFKSENSPENIKNYVEKAFRAEKLK
jgi:hypothetical protein